MDELNILYEDNHIIVVLKPQNLPTCEDESKDKDMLTMVKEYIKVTYNKPGNVFVGLVHRLDRPTGGILVFAKTSKAASRLSQNLKEGDFEKKYFAVVRGSMAVKKDKLVHYLKKNTITNVVTAVPLGTDGAKRCELDYVCLDEKEGVSLLDVNLLTGRSHQIRVQLKTNGNEIIGDNKYGTVKYNCNLALWAYHLSFSHPVKDERMVFRVQPPENTPFSVFETEKYVWFQPKN